MAEYYLDCKGRVSDEKRGLAHSFLTIKVPKKLESFLLQYHVGQGTTELFYLYETGNYFTSPQPVGENTELFIPLKIQDYIRTKFGLLQPLTAPVSISAPPNKYSRLIRGICYVDVYDVLRAFSVNCPAMQHAIKKCLAPGQRGVKSTEQDKREAIASIKRSLELDNDV